MPVARDQISELLEVLSLYLPDQEQIEPFLVDLLATNAARRNASFRETIQRVLAQIRYT